MKFTFLKKAVLFGITAAAIIDLSNVVNAKTITLDVQNGTDITDAFIEAAKQANETNEADTIVIPGGTYTIGSGENGQVRIWGNTTVKMDGVTLKRSASSQYSMLRFGSKSQDWDSYNGGAGRTGYSSDFSNIHFIGGTWDGGGCKNCIMQIGHAENISFQNVTFQNVQKSHHLEFAGVKDLKITGCTFKDYVGSFSDSYNGEAIQFEILSGIGNHFAGYNSVTDETICQNIEIANCKFINLKRGVGSHTAITNSYFNNIQIHNNEFSNITGYAISMLNYTNSGVYNNTITNCGAGIFCSTLEKSYKNMYASKKSSNSRSKPMVLNDKIYNNTITVNTGANNANYNNVNYGILICGEKLKSKKGTVPAGDWRISGVTVNNNNVTVTCTGYPIWLDGAYKNTISNNILTCNATEKGKGNAVDGIRLQQSTNNVIKKNKITNQQTEGVSDNLSGIKLIKNSDSNKLQNNTITGASKDGIYLEKCKKITITGNTIKESGRDGIYATPTCKKLTITKNKIQKTGRDGLYMKKNQLVKESGNKFSGIKRHKRKYQIIKKK